MTLHWPQIVWISLALLRLVVNMSNHGQPTNHKYNGGRALLELILSTLLFWCGGFFGGGAS